MRSRQRRSGCIKAAVRIRCLMEKRADLALLTSELETGPYPAGIPWFSTCSGGRVITAW